MSKYKKNKGRKSKKANINIPALTILLFLLFIFILTRNLIVTLIAFVIILAFNVYLKTPAGKGKVGELVVRVLIGRNKPKRAKYSIHNLTFYDGDKSVQIDHIVINQSGIHVIETKNYGGRIYGNEYDKNWTQVLAFGRVKHKLYNPIYQNYGHIKGLNSVLNKEEDIYHSYIVFTGRANIMNEFKTPVIYPIKINKSIKQKTNILSKEEVDNIYLEIIKLKKENTITNKEHIKAVKKIISNKEIDN